jgi:hypothetical protein
MLGATRAVSVARRPDLPRLRARPRGVARRGRPHRWRCAACGCWFHAAQGTVIEGTHLPLVAWFAAVQLLAEVPRLSSARLGRALGLRQKTAWSLARRARQLAAEDPLLHRIIVDVAHYGTAGGDITGRRDGQHRLRGDGSWRRARP